jgi:hypothetical protein
MMVLYGVQVDLLATFALHEAQAVVVAVGIASVRKAFEAWTDWELIDPYLLLNTRILSHCVDLIFVALLLLE